MSKNNANDITLMGLTGPHANDKSDDPKPNKRPPKRVIKRPIKKPIKKPNKPHPPNNETIRDRLRYYNDLVIRTTKNIEIHNLRGVDAYLNTHVIYEEIKLIETNIDVCSSMMNTSTDDDIAVSPVIIQHLQDVNDKFSKLFSRYGAPSISDIGRICIGSTYTSVFGSDSKYSDAYDIISSHAHPIRYRVVDWPKDMVQNIKPNFIAKRLLVSDEMIIKTAPMLECFDLSRTDDNFFVRVHGIKIAIHIPEKRHTILVDAIVDDVPINSLIRNDANVHTDRFIGDIQDIRYIFDNDPEMNTTQDKTSFNIFAESITIKQLVVFAPDDLYHQYKYMIYQSKTFNNEPLTKLSNDFMNLDTYKQRQRLITMIVGAELQEHRYIVNLLYEIVGIGYNGIGPSPEQVELLSSFPWSIKCYFSTIINQSVEYTKRLSNDFDPKQIPYEQRICLMKTNDVVKQKAMTKLKEVKSKNEDTGSKAKTYLDGLLDIPFGEFKQEAILDTTKKCVTQFKHMIEFINKENIENTIPVKEKYTSIDVNTYMNDIRKIMTDLKQIRIDKLMQCVMPKKQTKATLCETIESLSGSYNLFGDDIGLDISIYPTGSKQDLIDRIRSIVNGCVNELRLLDHFLTTFTPTTKFDVSIDTIEKLDVMYYSILAGYESVVAYTETVRDRLDDSVVGHDKAKRQIERVLAQWMNGDNGGYVFGFEGPPGVGKTSLAKYGIANCLVDTDGSTRPFAFIGVGGSSNGSTFEGHNYTYVGATWGRIVSILMDTKVSNPIIFIDEVDKISKTEHGREIIGILTHLVDPTQNSAFHDKYFSGIDIDLSKVLFVFSYNDVSAIDRVLLDRIHRVKFGALDESEKVNIVKTQMLPELLTRFKLDNSVDISEDVVKFIIHEYTCEPGVRKLKEILFEIVSEINLMNLQNSDSVSSTVSNGVVVVTTDMVKNDFLKERHSIREKMINSEPAVGVINGMWANAAGQGGVLPIESRKFPSGAALELKLTGMQGDVMKESMSVAKTLAWSLLSTEEQEICMKDMNGEVIKNGIHIHCPEGAVPKDGPSAGTAITIVMYSLMTGRRIKNSLSITGEMCLQGRVTAIGGLDLKILGAARAGVKEVIYPEENKRDFDDFIEKYSDMPGISEMTFYPVDRIEEVLKLVFVDE